MQKSNSHPEYPGRIVQIPSLQRTVSLDRQSFGRETYERTFELFRDEVKKKCVITLRCNKKEAREIYWELRHGNQVEWNEFDTSLRYLEFDMKIEDVLIHFLEDRNFEKKKVTERPAPTFTLRREREEKKHKCILQ